MFQHSPFGVQREGTSCMHDIPISFRFWHENKVELLASANVNEYGHRVKFQPLNFKLPVGPKAIKRPVNAPSTITQEIHFPSLCGCTGGDLRKQGSFIIAKNYSLTYHSDSQITDKYKVRVRCIGGSTILSVGIFTFKLRQLPSI